VESCPVVAKEILFFVWWIYFCKSNAETFFKVLGAGYYNDLTINCYVGYSSDGKKLFEINDGVNVEVRYCP
jgi:hypothetical protein